MDRQKLVSLFREGMSYPPGRHRFWITRCFEVQVREDEVVEVDEYEGFSAQNAQGPRSGDGRMGEGYEEMFHVGRTVLNLRDGRLSEEEGNGWAGSRRRRRSGPGVKKA